MKDPAVDVSNGVYGLCTEGSFEAIGPWHAQPEPDMRLIPHDSDLWEAGDMVWAPFGLDELPGWEIARDVLNQPVNGRIWRKL